MKLLTSKWLLYIELASDMYIDPGIGDFFCFCKSLSQTLIFVNPYHKHVLITRVCENSLHRRMYSSHSSVLVPCVYSKNLLQTCSWRVCSKTLLQTRRNASVMCPNTRL
jgi:hypothetical protein